MNRIALASIALLALGASASAQNVTNSAPPQSINGAYNASAPTCVDGNGCWLQTDINGNLKVATSGSTQAPLGKTTTQTKVTISVTNTYQQALAASSTRVGCTIQYVAVVGVKGYVFFGTSPADTTTSFQLTNGQSISCAIGGNAVATDAIQVTGTGTDIFVVSNQ